jgi:hypothetical protein
MSSQFNGKKFSTEWKKIQTQLFHTDAKNPTEYRRGQLTAIFILLLFIPTISLLINNIYYFFVDDQQLYTSYLISDAISIAFVVGIWQINRKGHVRTAAVIIIVFCTLAASFLYAPDTPNTAMIIYTLPIILSSFAIHSSASFFVYLLAFTTYSLAMEISNNTNLYDVTGLTALLVVSVITWVTAASLEKFIANNTVLYNNLQKSNMELQQAYETTLDGWSRALDLRDKETEGHTQRVTKLTVQIARAMKLSEEELLHIRRGALLHDIGKLGVPDSILNKEGPLTEDEWKIMRQHPQFVYDLLFPINYLHSALGIPYCHHEKWDGTGYPRGLKGTDIPLSARIFAIVDVYDALTSDRPYRRAWSKEQTLEHIQKESGTHFDPDIVKIFQQEIQNISC